MQTLIKIDKERLYDMYMDWVDRVTEECEWKTNFTAKEIVNEISNILEKNPQLYNFTVEL